MAHCCASGMRCMKIYEAGQHTYTSPSVWTSAAAGHFPTVWLLTFAGSLQLPICYSVWLNQHYMTVPVLYRGKHWVLVPMHFNRAQLHGPNAKYINVDMGPAEATLMLWCFVMNKPLQNSIRYKQSNRVIGRWYGLGGGVSESVFC